jgi:hypothetical protein
MKWGFSLAKLAFAPMKHEGLPDSTRMTGSSRNPIEQLVERDPDISVPSV